jgi:hypothetical protein
MAQYIMVSSQAKSITKGWAPEIETFWVLKLLRANRVPFGQKKSPQNH